MVIMLPSKILDGYIHYTKLLENRLPHQARLTSCPFALSMQPSKRSDSNKRHRTVPLSTLGLTSSLEELDYLFELDPVLPLSRHQGPDMGNESDNATSNKPIPKLFASFTLTLWRELLAPFLTQRDMCRMEATCRRAKAVLRSPIAWAGVRFLRMGFEVIGRVGTQKGR